MGGYGNFVTPPHDHKSVSTGGPLDGKALQYTPADPTDWNGSADPGDVNDALDQLADRVKVVEGLPPSLPTAAIVFELWNPAVGTKSDVRIPFACDVEKVTILADQTGSIVIDIWKDTYANYPPTVTDSITASAKPTISGAQKSEQTTFTGWDVTIDEDDCLRINVDSVSGITRATMIIEVTKV